jgi:hypothetical protein
MAAGGEGGRGGTLASGWERRRRAACLQERLQVLALAQQDVADLRVVQHGLHHHLLHARLLQLRGRAVGGGGG